MFSALSIMRTDRKMTDKMEATRIPLHHVPVALVVENITREKMAVSCNVFNTQQTCVATWLCYASPLQHMSRSFAHASLPIKFALIAGSMRC